MIRRTGIISNTIVTAPGTDYGYINEFIGKMKEVILYDPKISCIADNDPAENVIRVIKFEIIGIDHHLVISAVTDDFDAYEVKIGRQNFDDSSFLSTVKHTIGSPYTKAYDMFYDDDKTVMMIDGESAGTKNQVFMITRVKGLSWGSGEIVLLGGASGQYDANLYCSGTNTDVFTSSVIGGYTSPDRKYMFLPIYMLTPQQDALIDIPIKDFYTFYVNNVGYRTGSVLSDELYYYVGTGVDALTSGTYTATKWLRFAR